MSIVSHRSSLGHSLFTNRAGYYGRPGSTWNRADANEGDAMSPESLLTLGQIVGAVALVGLLGLFAIFVLGCASMSKYEQAHQAAKRDAQRDGLH